MVRRPGLAVARPESAFPALRLPSTRGLTGAVVVAAICALLYFLARVTPLFALTDISVTGARGQTADAVHAALAPYRGRSLVTVDAGSVAGELEDLPSVRSASVDRAFPHELRVTVVPEPAVAILDAGGEHWLVSARGRVIATAGRDMTEALPKVAERVHGTVRPGDLVGDPRVAPVLAAFAALPPRFPVRVVSGRADDGRVTLLLAPEVELRLGSGVALPLKLAVAARILAVVPRAERATLSYVDVSVPTRPVSGSKAQLEG